MLGYLPPQHLASLRSWAYCSTSQLLHRRGGGMWRARAWYGQGRETSLSGRPCPYRILRASAALHDLDPRPGKSPAVPGFPGMSGGRLLPSVQRGGGRQLRSTVQAGPAPGARLPRLGV